jgi:hypothetical protein
VVDLRRILGLGLPEKLGSDSLWKLSKMSLSDDFFVDFGLWFVISIFMIIVLINNDHFSVTSVASYTYEPYHSSLGIASGIPRSGIRLAQACGSKSLDWDLSDMGIYFHVDAPLWGALRA